MNHVLNLAVQAFLKKIKALPPKEVEVPDLKDKEDEDEDEGEDEDDNGDYGDDNMGVGINGDEEEKDDGDEDILNNPAAVEEEDEYIEADFQGTMKKLHSIAKVHVVVYKMRFSALLDPFCKLQVLCSKLTGRKLTAAVFKKNSSNVHVNTTKSSPSN